ncbi:SPOR domain-containing protein [Xylophilus sp. GOD-11R]|uniref:SPOR domain-containing protein n=1 Tax=Xylophilus sp. GOD-11R TaxID=3089814 RepID=UPI00298C6954|nr:SPOR domain-containing protein [Xylophilus sp. GOD-11R]WPB57234.1 SPOR domain-containing protein [Xylophilus sp. GOD-11R]
MSPVRQSRRQFGGTFLGIVIGVVLGLGAALAVAVYVTKVPIPFMNRNSTRGAEQDALEAQKNRDWDPNSVLGKRAAGGKPAVGVGSVAPPGAAAGVATPQIPAADPTIPAAPATATAPATAAGRPAAPASSDPLGDLARARSAAAPSSASTAATTPAPGNAEAFEYLIQAGAFRTEADADAQRARLAIMGWEARVSEREQAGRTVYRVRIGPFTRRDDAERLKDTLDGSGMESTLVRVQR